MFSRDTQVIHIRIRPYLTLGCSLASREMKTCLIPLLLYAKTLQQRHTEEYDCKQALQFASLCSERRELSVECSLDMACRFATHRYSAVLHWNACGHLVDPVIHLCSLNTSGWDYSAWTLCWHGIACEVLGCNKAKLFHFVFILNPPLALCDW